MAGFTNPKILSLANSSTQERAWLGAVEKRLLASGRYKRIVEPCCGAFALAAYHLQAGFPATAIETSDITLFSSVLGLAIEDRPMAELGVKVDGEPVALSGDSLSDGAVILWHHALLRFQKMETGGKLYYHHLVEDLQTRSGAHQTALRQALEALRHRFRGLRYRAQCMFDHMAEAADDPAVIINVSPPSYKAGFERFYNTGGRLTWTEPRYRVFEPGRHHAEMFEAAKSWKALLLCQHETKPGTCAGPAVYCREVRADWSVYIACNRPDEVLDGKRGVVVPRSVPEPEPLNVSVIPPDYEIRPDARIEVAHIADKHASYYKGMWVHRLGVRHGEGNAALFIDGYLAGVWGYSDSPIVRHQGEAWRDHVMLVYAAAPPHQDRLARLVTMISLCRSSIATVVTPVILAQVNGVFTSEFTRYPEQKANRGIMKLVRRDQDGDRFRLIYAAPVTEKAYGEVLADWRKKESQWQSARQQQQKAG